MMTVKTTDASLAAVPVVANYTVTTLDNNDLAKPGKPVKQVTYKGGAVDSVSLFSGQLWNSSDESWMIGTVTTVKTTDASVGESVVWGKSTDLAGRNIII